MRWTSLWRTTSSPPKRTNSTPSTSSRMSPTTSSPDFWSRGRSTCVTSPVTTIFEPNPSRVRNIFICSGVVFCASSRITNESLIVRPRMKASGATSITPLSRCEETRSGSSMSCSASNSGRRYGSTFAIRSPGRKPSRSPASTAGRVRMIRLTSRRDSAATAIAIARNVLPVPAGPMPNVIVSCRIASTYFFWLTERGATRRLRWRQTTSSSTVAGDSRWSSTRATDSIVAGPMSCPRSTIAESSRTTVAAWWTASASPSRVTTFPRRKSCASRCSSRVLRIESWAPASCAATSFETSSCLRAKCLLHLVGDLLAVGAPAGRRHHLLDHPAHVPRRGSARLRHRGCDERVELGAARLAVGQLGLAPALALAPQHRLLIARALLRVLLELGEHEAQRRDAVPIPRLHGGGHIGPDLFGDLHPPSSVRRRTVTTVRRMRAAILREYDATPELGSFDDPAPGGGTVVADVLAAGLNPVDVRKASGVFPLMPKPPLPSVAGWEGVARLEDGSRAYFVDPPPPHGALAERTLLDPATTYPVPEGVDDGVAVALGIAGLAGWLALSWSAKLREGETVLVLGATGTVGQVAVQGAKLMGASRVVAAGRNPHGLARAAQLGADATVRLGEEGDLAEHLKG